jgi:hypothetical protein
MTPSITPETKIGELLAAYPALEPLLIRYAPAFKALQNPILRRTVARVASLAQAAQVGGVPVRDLVAALRTAAGCQGHERVEAEEPVSAGPAPDWLDESRVRVTIDVDRLLAAGEVPLVHAQHALQGLLAGDLLRLTSSFRPAPLVDALHQSGHRTFSTSYAPDRFHTYVLPHSSARKPRHPTPVTSSDPPAL